MRRQHGRDFSGLPRLQILAAVKTLRHGEHEAEISRAADDFKRWFFGTS
jgi:hypothetical protein